MLFAVMNILTGFFVEQAMKVASEDLEHVIREETHKRANVIANLRKIFREADADESGKVTWEELRADLNDKRVMAFFKTLELDIWDIRTFFDLLQIWDRKATSVD